MTQVIDMETRRKRMSGWSEEIIFYMGNAKAYGTYVIQLDEHDVEHIHLVVGNERRRFNVGRKVGTNEAFCRIC